MALLLKSIDHFLNVHTLRNFSSCTMVIEDLHKRKTARMLESWEAGMLEGQTKIKNIKSGNRLSFLKKGFTSNNEQFHSGSVNFILL
jgi:hypothetical protein